MFQHMFNTNNYQKVLKTIMISYLISFMGTAICQVYNELPENFPEFEVTVSEKPDPGYYFLSGAYLGNTTSKYIIIIDTLGFPICFQKLPLNSWAQGFTLQENGNLSYFGGNSAAGTANFKVLNGTFSLVNELNSQNGYIIDPHELIIMSDNSYWLLAFDIREIDMSIIVNGGQTNASVIGCVIQHMDDSNNVLFEWNSWDHFEITDCDTNFVDLQGYIIDYVHANSISFDKEWNILLSSRYLNEITKIDKNNGDIIWRWGGHHNQFSSLQGEDPFYGQHTIDHISSNDTYVLFDNGNFHDPPYSRGLEFELDEEEMTSSKLKAFRHDPDIFSPSMGGMQRLDNGNSVINWSKDPCIFTEFNEDQDVVFEVYTVDSIFSSYRVSKHDWETSLFSCEEDELHFENTELGDSSVISLNIINNQPYPVAINGHHIGNHVFKLITDLPVVIPANSNSEFVVSFRPLFTSNYESVLSIFHSTDTSRIGNQIRLKGATIVGIDDTCGDRSSNVLIKPNPLVSETEISLKNNEEITSVEIFDSQGRRKLVEHIGAHSYRLSSQDMNQGQYVIRVRGSKGVYSGILLVDY